MSTSAINALSQQQFQKSQRKYDKLQEFLENRFFAPCRTIIKGNFIVFYFMLFYIIMLFLYYF